MSRTLLRSHTLLLWFSLFAAASGSALFSAGCSSSDDSGTAGAGKGGGHSGGAASKGGGSSADAGDPGDSGDAGDSGDGEGGRTETPSGGSGGKVGSGGSASGGSPGSGDAGDTGEGGSAGSADAVDEELAAAQARAVALIDGLEMTRKCTSCHDVTYQGSGFYPNITPDVDTGIGSWSADEIKAAIRDGKDKDGKTLCATMERFPFSEAELADIVVYLQHLPAVKKKISGKCPVP